MLSPTASMSPSSSVSGTLSSPPSSEPPRSSDRSSGLAPPPSPYPQHVDPSPTDSNGTDATEIDDDSQEEATEDTSQPTPPSALVGSGTVAGGLSKIATDVLIRSRANSDDAPQSVIRLTSEFVDFSPIGSASTTLTTLERRESRLASPTTPDAALGPDDKRMSVASHINTDMPPEGPVERLTPRAQTRQEADEDSRTRSRASSRLQKIPESIISDNGIQSNLQQQSMHPIHRAPTETSALRAALVECWTLCNTLATLSSQHRQRVFVMSGSNGLQEHAWQSCWRLCQELYHETYQSPLSDPEPTLDLCREFCQALFEVRHRGDDEATDSVLRVSFEMNNHLYNTHDRQLPTPFLVRTLEFYVTLCHRMMKRRTMLSQETDALLRACWSLAEMLFSLRQASYESRCPDEELLGSAVQACWELCDLFREGWTQVRPDRRSTPRPSQTDFPSNSRTANQSAHSTRASSSLSDSSYHDAAPTLPPETPVTIFDDTASVSTPDSVNAPNILVLGPATNSSLLARGTHHDRWSSNASTLSGYSESASSKRSSSTASTEGTHLLRLQYLILKAAMDAGFARSSTQPITAFVRGLSNDVFGPLPWQKQLFKHYKSLVEADASLRALGHLPSKRLTAREAARAVTWLARDEKWTWVRDLFRLVFDFGVDDASVAANGHSLQLQV